MTTDPISRSARAAARRLAETHGAALEPQVEAALYARARDQRPTQYLDPVALGSLIVSVATLAWTVITDWPPTRPRPTREDIKPTVKDELNIDDPSADEVIDVVVDESLKDAEEEE
ncbi:hypothetical protein BBK82_07980 [Lentzea guizhouensis]|uniref:Uncharacterized protein n=1 Tax=Lentzea guizhouensis TaxID=1586287 RepID=A0A1B2HE57_9PSEU|nr:hypothetical protein [Lentzea guizhouensis]ANZ36015.1 hypothetical protein BBK82_07980 [Lentzea guizhouensis]